LNILLVKPYNLSDHIQPPLGLGYLATALRKNHKVHLLDCIKTGIKPEHLENYITRGSYNAVGFQCYTYDLPILRPLIKMCKKKGLLTLVGGPHPSAVPRETMEYFGSYLDYCFQGEAEIGLPILIDTIDGKKNYSKEEIPGLVWRKKEKIILNEKKYVNDLDILGTPSWDLLRPEEYPEAQHGAFFKNFPIAPIIATRGCPYACTFCAGNLISGKVCRKRSPNHVVDEIKMLYNKHAVREIHIIDDNFTLDKKFAKEILRHIKKSGLKISWSVPNGVRMESLDDELLGLMKDTGLYLVSLGIESGSDRVLDLMKKKTSVSFIRETVKRIQKFGIDVAGFFIIGFPGETIKDIEKTIKFSLELDLIRANYFTYLPFPGTESYASIKREEGLEKINWDRFFFFGASYSPKGIDAKALRKLQKKAFIKFYFRPSIFWKNVKQIKSLKHFKFLFKRFFNWLLRK